MNFSVSSSAVLASMPAPLNIEKAFVPSVCNLVDKIPVDWPTRSKASCAALCKSPNVASNCAFCACTSAALSTHAFPNSMTLSTAKAAATAVPNFLKVDCIRPLPLSACSVVFCISFLAVSLSITTFPTNLNSSCAMFHHLSSVK